VRNIPDAAFTPQSEDREGNSTGAWVPRTPCVFFANFGKKKGKTDLLAGREAKGKLTSVERCEGSHEGKKPKSKLDSIASVRGDENRQKGIHTEKKHADRNNFGANLEKKATGGSKRREEGKH